MKLSETLVSVWKQALEERAVGATVEGTSIPFGRTRARGLVCITFTYQGNVIDGIEQNPEKDSRWAKLAHEGKRIMQFSARRRYFANVCEGVLTRYPSWKGLGLPE